MHNVLDTVPVHSSKRSSDVSCYDGGTPELGAISYNRGGERLPRKVALNEALIPEWTFTKGRRGWEAFQAEEPAQEEVF